MPSFSEVVLPLARDRELVVFDLDNTLIEESRYLFAGYAAVAAVAAGDDAKLARTLAAWLRDEFECSGRERLFDRMAAAWPQVKGTVADWLEQLRGVEVELPVFPWVEELCAALPALPMAILTNGNAAQQRNKYRLMQPAALRDRMRLYCAAEIRSKPSPAGLWRILEDHRCPPHAALMIGDAESDAACAAAAGVSFVMVPPAGPAR